MNEISRKLESKVPLSSAEPTHHTRHQQYLVLHVMNQRDYESQWVSELQPIKDEAKESVLSLYFMYAVHFTLEALTCHVWCREPLYLKTGAGRNLFYPFGCV